MANITVRQLNDAVNALPDGPHKAIFNLVGQAVHLVMQDFTGHVDANTQEFGQVNQLVQDIRTEVTQLQNMGTTQRQETAVLQVDLEAVKKQLNERFPPVEDKAKELSDKIQVLEDKLTATIPNLEKQLQVKDDQIAVITGVVNSFADNLVKEVEQLRAQLDTAVAHIGMINAKIDDLKWRHPACQEEP